jgi:DNA replication and repair protein RecF
VTDSPITRRKDIDGFLSVYDEGYYSELSEYSKIVRGRNKILEKIQMRKGKISELSFWNASLVELGATIISKRKSLLQKTNPTMAKLASKLFNGDFNELSVHYVSKFTTEENTLDEVKRSFSSKIANNIKKEIFVGKSLYGPHREDFVFNLNGHTLRDFGSRGQQRLCSFLYKVAQHDMLQKKQDISPILLIDDLFSELDMQVRKRIQKFLESLSAQILLTGLNRTEFEKSFLKNAEVIEL